MKRTRASLAAICITLLASVPATADAKTRAKAGKATAATVLQPMPSGMVTQTGNGASMALQVQAIGLTPSSMHRVELANGGCSRSGRMRSVVSMGTVSADSGGAVDASVNVPAGQMRSHQSLVLLIGTPPMGSGASRVIACASLHGHWNGGATPLASELGSGKPSTGSAQITYDATTATLTVHVQATGFMPGSTHAAHIHAGSCAAQGPVLYMLPDLVADASGNIDATRTVTGVMSAPPPSGWYLNIHLGDSQTILTANGQPTLAFQPRLCGDIAGMASSTHGQTTTSGGEQFLSPGQTATVMTVGPFSYTASCTTVQSGGASYNQAEFNVVSSEANSDLDGGGPVPAGQVVNIHTDGDLIPNPQGQTPVTPALANGTFDQTPSASTSTEIAPDGTEVDIFYNDGVNLDGHACFAGAVAFTS